MKYHELDTPSLLVDYDIFMNNLTFMQEYADRNHVALRPHTKTHKSPELANIQLEAGACGIAVAKTGEAEIMAAHGLTDIFIANEVVGDQKLKRIRKLAESVTISFGVDCPEHVEAAERIFAAAEKPAEVLIEIEVGENRSGIIEENDFFALLDTLKRCPHVHLKGLFSHDGNCYSAESVEACTQIAVGAQERTLHFAKLAEDYGFPCEVISYGSTPTFMNQVPILPGITELRPGTYALMDASQGNAIGTLERCAASVLATVISRPTSERVILDVGAKGMTMQSRTVGICATPGKGTLPDYPGVTIDHMYDEHAIIYNAAFRDQVRVGDKVRIIPVHICPVCNLYDTMYLIQGEEVIREVKIACRGALR
ncbi:MAG: D-TA family PLP-dependent enzyme [Lachnoclostridium sp.]|nr:D-TA family PLP-dependent enzyme [Lachnoclostridium sp.]